MIEGDTAFLAVCDKSYPKPLAFFFLQDVQREFHQQHPESTYVGKPPKPYAFMDFERFIKNTVKAESYSNPRASSGLEQLNNQLQDVQGIMKKNIEDIINRGDSLNKMGEMSGRLREESAKYRRAAVRINWELLLKQVSIL